MAKDKSLEIDFRCHTKSVERRVKLVTKPHKVYLTLILEMTFLELSCNLEWECQILDTKISLYFKFLSLILSPILLPCTFFYVVQ